MPFWVPVASPVGKYLNILFCFAVCYNLLPMTLHIYPYSPPLSLTVLTSGVMCAMLMYDGISVL